MAFDEFRTNSERLQAEELSALVPVGTNTTNVVATTTGEDSWKRGTGCVRISLPRVCWKSYLLVRSTILRDFLIVRINDVEVTRAIISCVRFRTEKSVTSVLEVLASLGNIFLAFDCTVYVCTYVFAIVIYECLRYC